MVEGWEDGEVVLKEGKKREREGRDGNVEVSSGSVHSSLPEKLPKVGKWIHSSSLRW